ncbi:MAG: hypothetical protein WC775_02225 [Patescibacteria group bacterium]|jgi:uncharacterized membrane protein YozB (DUF420 family)
MYLLSLFPIKLSIHQLVLITNSIVLIGLLIAVELWSTNDTHKDKAKYYYPLIMLFIFLMMYAGYVQFATPNL